ncbi:MAG: 3-deoxy-manno-octulosonate cytidylyltransferase [Bacteroidetes bacterium]|nr:3-deoxy-manno-octulosonate cytidylyltransferase [Bacteroidota bacterium]
MKSVAIIPARYNSSRFPGKPLATIGGVSMVRRVYEIVSSVGLDFVAVATDDSRIYDHVKSWGGEVIMTSENCINGTERVAEAITHLSFDPEFVLNIQGDEPFIKPQQIMQVANALKDPGTGISTLKKKIENEEEFNNQNVVKVVTDTDDFALYFSRSPIPFIRDKSSSISSFHAFYKHLGVYGFKKNILMDIVRLPESILQKIENLEQLCWLENGYLIKVLETDFQSLAVDVPEDLAKAEKYLKN